MAEPLALCIDCFNSDIEKGRLHSSSFLEEKSRRLFFPFFLSQKNTYLLSVKEYLDRFVAIASATCFLLVMRLLLYF